MQTGEVIDKAQAVPKKPLAKAMLERFHVDLANGVVWLDDRRVLVLQAEWFLDLRGELINQLGQDGARAVMTRLGYAAGVRDAQTSRKLNPDYTPRELVSTGREFHALQGSARAEALSVELDLASKHFHAEFVWRNTIEDEADTPIVDQAHGESCWMEIGYCSGFLSTCLNGEVIVREIGCASQGYSECRCVARFAHEWDDVSEDRRFLDAGDPLQHCYRTPLARSHRLVPITTTRSSEASFAQQKRAPSLVGRSATFGRMLHSAQRVGKTEATALLLGESGVGKSALARYIHLYSDRADQPFVEVNCAAIPETLLESELFGVERGAFTGATQSRTGRFEEADGGTLFLDEVGLLTAAAQGKLLRVLQTQEFERLGSSKTRQANARLVAATNTDLIASVRDGSFRSDLFYRLSVFPITVPPLRQRVSDLPLLVDHLVSRLCRKYDRHPKGITADAYRAILQHDWPGNIRELENVLERAVILLDAGEAIDVHHLFTNDSTFERAGLHWLDEHGKLTDARVHADNSNAMDIWADLAVQQTTHTLQEIEQAVVIATLRTCNGNVIKTAKHLGITRAQIDYRLKKWAIEPRHFTSSR